MCKAFTQFTLEKTGKRWTMKNEGKSLKSSYPLLITGRDWRKRIPPKRSDKKMTGKIYMTNDDWMDFYNLNRKQYGNNIMDWPKHKRDYVKRISLVKVVQVELKQARLPYSNTGVDKQVYE